MSSDELRLNAAHALALGAHVEIAGRWAWAKFPIKPSDAVRAELTALGWRWSSRHGKWYLKGCMSSGNPNRSMGWSYIINRYGVEELSI